MMEKSGGMIGFTRDIGRFAKTSRSGQACCFAIGLFIFFDDYASVLLAGQTMRSLMDTLMVSREKLSFIVDATAAPIASISPISSWGTFCHFVHVYIVSALLSVRTNLPLLVFV
jgi:Na+/H+ antiporter NhaC